MEVILLQDVRKYGKKGDVIKVKDGYANNCLFPQNLAKPFNKQNANELRNEKAAEAHREEMKEFEANEIKNKIDGKCVRIAVKVGENGKMYGSVTSKDIAEKINETFDVNVDKKKIHLNSEEEMHTLGNYSFTIKLHKNISAQMIVSVVNAVLVDVN